MIGSLHGAEVDDNDNDDDDDEDELVGGSGAQWLEYAWHHVAFGLVMLPVVAVRGEYGARLIANDGEC